MEPTAPDISVPAPVHESTLPEQPAFSPEPPQATDISHMLSSQGVPDDPETQRQMAALQSMFRKAEAEQEGIPEPRQFPGPVELPKMQGKQGLGKIIASLFHFFTFGIFRKK